MYNYHVTVFGVLGCFHQSLASNYQNYTGRSSHSVTISCKMLIMFHWFAIHSHNIIHRIHYSLQFTNNPCNILHTFRISAIYSRASFQRSISYKLSGYIICWSSLTQFMFVFTILIALSSLYGVKYPLSGLLYLIVLFASHYAFLFMLK